MFDFMREANKTLVTVLQTINAVLLAIQSEVTKDLVPPAVTPTIIE